MIKTSLIEGLKMTRKREENVKDRALKERG